MRSNPGKTLTIYDVPALVNEAQISSCVPRNIIARFHSTGIFPYDSDIFTDDLVYWGLTPQQHPGSYQGSEMMMKSVFWWRKPEYPEETTDLRQVTDETFHTFTDDDYAPAAVTDRERDAPAEVPGLVYCGLTPQQQSGSYQGGEMMMRKSVFWWRKVPGGNHRPTASNS